MRHLRLDMSGAEFNVEEVVEMQRCEKSRKLRVGLLNVVLRGTDDCAFLRLA
jgi:hypothetical protein